MKIIDISNLEFNGSGNGNSGGCGYVDGSGGCGGGSGNGNSGGSGYG